MLKLVIADDEGKKTVVPLVRDEITIGRKEGNTIRLTERNVSRRHARIVRRASDYLLEDLASYNGIVVNNARLVEARPIRHGDEIRIGDYTLQIVDEPGVQPAPTPPPPAAPSEPIVPLLSATPSIPAATDGAATGAAARPASDALATSGDTASQPVPESIRGLRLVFLAPAGVPAPVMLDRLPIVMGRSEAADVALPFSSISREHARLFLEDDKLMIEDMGSSNGVQINGEKCRKGQLAPGDMVQLGVVEFRVARRGDNTVMIQKTAFEEKARAGRRPPLGLIGAIVGGGLALGLAVVLVVNKMNPNPASAGAHNPPAPQTTQPLAVAVPAPAPVQPVVVPVAPQPPAPAVPEAPPLAAQPEVPAQPAQPAQPEVQAPAPAVPEAPPQQPAVQPEAPPQAAQPAAPAVAPEAPPVRQTLETSQQRRARERAERQANARPAAAVRERPTPAAPTVRERPTPPAAAPAAAATPDDGMSPMQRAQACRSSTSDEPSRNNCIINALRGHASSMQELGMLGATQMAAGRGPDASRTMRTYIQRYPQGPLVPTFQRYIDSHP